MKNNINRTKGLRGVAFALLPLLLTCVLLFACSVTYKFNGASIDYTRQKPFKLTIFPFVQPMYGDQWRLSLTMN